MLCLKKSFTVQPARPEEAQAQAQAQDEAQAQAQDEREEPPEERDDELREPEEREEPWDRETGTLTTCTRIYVLGELP